MLLERGGFPAAEVPLTASEAADPYGEKPLRKWLEALGEAVGEELQEEGFLRLGVCTVSQLKARRPTDNDLKRMGVLRVNARREVLAVRLPAAGQPACTLALWPAHAQPCAALPPCDRGVLCTRTPHPAPAPCPTPALLCHSRAPRRL